MATSSDQSDWGLDAGWLIDYLLKQGLRAEEIARQTGIHEHPSTLSFLSIDAYLSLFSWASRCLNRPQLGLDISRKLQPSSLGLYGYLMDYSPTVGALFEQLVHYQPIFMRGMGYTKLVSGGQVELEWTINRPACEGVRLDVEFTMSALVRLLRIKVGDAATPLRATFKHAASACMEDYHEAFGCECNFGQQQNSMLFAESMMQTPLAGADPQLLDILKVQADTLLQAWQQQTRFLERVRELIARTFDQPDGGVTLVAQQLNLSPRTLNRRLAKEGSSYQRLREEVVVHMAKRALSESQTPIALIAGELGFSESSAFIRAFRRAVGVTPRNYRAEVKRIQGGITPASGAARESTS
jgi:AraC-like DNA-binding protein